MSAFSFGFLRLAFAGAALALMGGCGLLSRDAGVPPPSTPPATLPPAGSPPAAVPDAPPPSSGGLFGRGGLFGGAPDPGSSPEAHAAWQLEELAGTLSRDLQGTPVEVQLTDASLLRVAVPAHYCFDAGRSSVKQPLAAVLDRMAAQLKQKPSLDVLVAGPSDARDSNALLARDRAAAARDYIIARGIPAARFAVVEHPTTTGLEIRVAPRKNLRGSGASQR
jgi:hypothetical protein